LIVTQKDIVVLGGGIAGLAAAVKAGRMGARVLLLERYPFIGGMATAGMVSPFMRYSTAEHVLVRGIFEDLQFEMNAHQGMLENGFRADIFRFAARTLLENAGVEVWTQTELIGVNTQGRVIESLEVLHGNHPKRVLATHFIDTSGDAQLANLAQFPTLQGREDTAVSQTMTLFFRMGGIDFNPILEQVRSHPDNFFAWVDPSPDSTGIVSIAGFFKEAKIAQEQKRLDETIDYIFFNSLPGKGEASFNTTAINEFSSIRSEDLTQAEFLANHQVHQVVDMLIADIKGFQNAYLIETATQIGVRESRRIVGDVVLQAHSIRSGEKFPDKIARGCYGVDIHGNTGEDDIMEELAEDMWYDVPRGTLIARDADNLLAAGRCLSASFEAHGALRIMPTSAATGEACGAWAALALQQSSTLRAVPADDLQKFITHNIEA
jgi:hypothetical protein